MTRALSVFCSMLLGASIACGSDDDEPNDIGGTGGISAGGQGGAAGATGGTGATMGGTGGNGATGGTGTGGAAGAGGSGGSTDASAGRGGSGAGGSAGTTPVDAGGKGGGSDASRDVFADASRDVFTDARDGSSGDANVNIDAGAGCGAANVVTKAFFDSIFPVSSRNAVYTYEGFIAASMSYPAFLNTGSLDSCRKEAAAFLANVARETGRLRYAEEIAKSVLCSTKTGCVCDPNTTDQSKWYYGRGAIQLSWNYNYCSAGTALGTDLLTQPMRVATDPEFAWSTAVWFWMTSTSAGATTCHSTITGTGIFGDTIRIINGGECGVGGYNSVSAVKERVDAYIEFAKALGIPNPGMPTDLDC